MLDEKSGVWNTSLEQSDQIGKGESRLIKVGATCEDFVHPLIVSQFRRLW
jgi:hypothetical protein